MSSTHIAARNGTGAFCTRAAAVYFLLTCTCLPDRSQTCASYSPSSLHSASSCKLLGPWPTRDRPAAATTRRAPLQHQPDVEEVGGSDRNSRGHQQQRQQQQHQHKLICNKTLRTTSKRGCTQHFLSAAPQSNKMQPRAPLHKLTVSCPSHNQHPPHCAMSGVPCPPQRPQAASGSSAVAAG